MFLRCSVGKRTDSRKTEMFFLCIRQLCVLSHITLYVVSQKIQAGDRLMGLRLRPRPCA